MYDSDVPCLIYNYLRECGYLHSAAALACDAMISLSEPILDLVDPGLLRVLIGKGLAYAQLESLCLGDDVLGTQTEGGVAECNAVSIEPAKEDDLENRERRSLIMCLWRGNLGSSSADITGGSYILRVMRFGPSIEPVLPSRLVVLTSHGLYLIDEKTQSQLAHRPLLITKELAEQAFVCPDGLTFSLVAKIKPLEAEHNEKMSETNSSFHFLVINTVTLYVLYRYSLVGPTKSVSMGSKWVTCVCDQRGNALIIPRPISTRSKSHLDLSVHPLPDEIIDQCYSRMGRGVSDKITSEQKGWSVCAFQSAGACHGLSSYFFSIKNEVLVLYSSIGILHLYVPFLDEDTPTLTSKFVNLAAFLKISTINAELSMVKMRFIESLPYLVCLTTSGIVVLNYVQLLYGPVDQEKQYSSWTYCDDMKSALPILDIGLWNGKGSILICPRNRITILAIETGTPLFVISLIEFITMHSDQVDWRLENNNVEYNIADIAFIDKNELAVLIAEGTGPMVWCLNVVVDCLTKTLESTVIYKGVTSLRRFAGESQDKKAKRLYLSLDNGDIIELNFPRSPPRLLP